MIQLRRVLVLMGPLAVPFACAIDEPCDPGQNFENGACVPEGGFGPPPPDGATGGDSGDGDGAASGGAMGDGDSSMGGLGGMGGDLGGDGDTAGDGDGDGDAAGDGDTAGDGDASGDGDAAGDGDGDAVVEEPNPGTPCTSEADCQGGTVCDPYIQLCVAYCGAGDPFESGCPAEHTCTPFYYTYLCIPNEFL